MMQTGYLWELQYSPYYDAYLLFILLYLFHHLFHHYLPKFLAQGTYKYLAPKISVDNQQKWFEVVNSSQTPQWRLEDRRQES